MKVTETSRLFEVTVNTVRTWSKEFADYLSPTANPKKGKARFYTEDDLTVLALIAFYRGENAPYTDIHTALANGERAQPPQAHKPQPDPPKNAPHEASELVPAQVLERFAERLTNQFHGQIEVLENERDHLRDTVENERLARLDAEKRAAQLPHLQQNIEAEREARARAEAEARELSDRAIRAETQAELYRAQLDEMAKQDVPADDKPEDAQPPRRWWHRFTR